MKHVLAIVATSEKTWHFGEKYLFNEYFLKNRIFFDLAIVCNGFQAEAEACLKALAPEYLFFRENKGYDIAALDYAIKKLPHYPHYLFLHEDNWFFDDAWFEKLDRMQMSNLSLDIFGNLVTDPAHSMEGFDQIFVQNNLSFRQADFPHFLQGYTGWYRGAVIDFFLKIGGIPGFDQSSRLATHIFERFTSYLLMMHGYRFGQIPPGYEKFLMHADWKTTPDKKKAEMAAALAEYSKADLNFHVEDDA